MTSRATPFFQHFSLATVILLATLSSPGNASAQSEVRTTPDIDRVIDGALRFLARNQSESGAFEGVRGRERQHPVAITAYALMAFLATGNLPNEGRYGANVTAAVDFLLNSLQPTGLYGDGHGGQYMYEHGIATIALAEVYGQTTDKRIKEKLDAAIKIIISAQNREGGWRYTPTARDADISVTVLQVVALRVAKNAGFNVPQQTIDKAVEYVRRCYKESEGGFAYQPGQGAGFARTSAAIYSLQVCGEYGDPRIEPGSEFLFQNVRTNDRWFTYGNFYAAPAQYMIGGGIWERWYSSISKLLVEGVEQDGDLYYWDRKLDRRGEVGPTYNTAVYAMVLAMPYNYIPLYQR